MATLVLATGYIGAGTFLEVYDSLTLFPSLAFIFLSLSFLINGLRKDKISFEIVASLILLAISIVALRVRAFTYIIPVLAVIYLFPGKWKFGKRLVLSLMYTVLHFGVFFYGSPVGAISIVSGLKPDLLVKVKYFFANLGSLILIEVFEIEKLSLYVVTGVVLSLVFLYFLFKNRNKREVTIVSFFGVIWYISQYAPYGMRTDWLLQSDHRYLLPSFPGFLLVLVVFLSTLNFPFGKKTVSYLLVWF